MSLTENMRNKTFGEAIEHYRAELNRMEQGLPSEFSGCEASVGFRFDDGIDIKITIGRGILDDDNEIIDFNGEKI